MVGLFGFDDQPSAVRFGYWVVHGHRRSGLAAAAVRLLAEWAFNELDVDALLIDIEPDNEPSLRVATAVGATHERQLTRCLAGEDIVLERCVLGRQDLAGVEPC